MGGTGIIPATSHLFRGWFPYLEARKSKFGGGFVSLKVKMSARLKSELFDKAKALVEEGVFDSVTSVVEEALKIYFANYKAEVWEKRLNGGWVKKLVIREGNVTFESIRCRKVYTRFNPKYFTSEALESRGFLKIWKMKKEKAKGKCTPSDSFRNKKGLALIT